MNNSFWKYINKHPFLTVILISILITAILHIVGVYFFEYWTGNKQLDAKNDFDIFGGIISYFSGVLSVITIIFLYINYHQIKEQNDKNNLNSEFNRIIDLVYRQMELSLPQIKNNRYIALRNEFGDLEKQDNEIADYTDTFNEPILIYLINTKEHIKNLIFIISSSNLDANIKEHIRNLVCNNLNNDFKYLFETFKTFSTRYPNDTFGMLEHIEEILTIYTPMQES